MMMIFSKETETSFINTIAKHPKTVTAYKKGKYFYIEYMEGNTLRIERDRDLHKLQHKTKKKLGILLWNH